MTDNVAGFDRRSLPKGAQEQYWQAQDGWKIRRMDWPNESKDSRGSMLFMPGRGDIYEKYLETLNHLHGHGWNITACDWRGQGASGRMADSQYVGHIDDFSTWIGDIGFFWSKWIKETPGPHVIMAHSMGGHLVARALVDGAITPDACILSAPMLGMSGPPLPLAVSHLFARIMCKIGNPARPAWKVSEKPGTPIRERQSLLTHHQARYDDEAAWWAKRPELVLGPASWQWVERAYASVRHIHAPGQWEKVTTPILILAASEDKLVSHDAIVEASARLPNAKLVTYGEECAHELLREVDAVRDLALAEIDLFLEQSLATARSRDSLSA
ncbi:alpha/beta fold hydrolase [Parasphingorhabdus sp. DH2-15]|uniref:alpha/beta fold hydrolase n=1 Tax=Parasphingorhabdus sp. DH2-15 TaxID=3444112 RepID=UPI003F6884F9